MGQIILLTGDQCPNCELIKRVIFERGLSPRVTYLDAMLEGRDLVKQYSITSVPAMIFEGSVYRTFSEIYKLVTRDILH